MNSICFNQNDPGFTLGVLAFTRVVSADTIGEPLPAAGNPSTFVGEIMDADTLFLPNDPNNTFATPAALPSHPNAYDLESIVTHELGHTFGFNHSGVWAAMMFPFAPPPGQFTGARPTAQSPDAPLSDDDRTGSARPVSGPKRHCTRRRDQRARTARESSGFAHFSGRGYRHLSRTSGGTGQRNRNGDRRGPGRLELQRPRPGAIRRHFFSAAIAGRNGAELRNLRGAAGWAGVVEQRDLQRYFDLPERSYRSGLARAICVHGSGVRRAVFSAIQARALKYFGFVSVG